MNLADARIPVTVRQQFLETVAQMLVADFQVTLEESAFFDRLVAQLGLDEGQRDEVIRRVDIGTEIEQQLGKIPRPIRNELQRVLAEAAASDGEVAPRELDLLEKVAVVLKILEANPGLSAPDLDLDS